MNTTCTTLTTVKILFLIFFMTKCAGEPQSLQCLQEQKFKAVVCTGTSFVNSLHRNVFVSLPCTTLQFRCVDDGTCIDKQFRCDNSKECDDLSDEVNCSANIVCTEGLHLCNNGQCVSRGARCNGLQECSDGSDESSCVVATTESDTSSTSIDIIMSSYSIHTETTMSSSNVNVQTTAMVLSTETTLSSEPLSLLTDTKSSSLPIETTTHKEGDRPDEKKDQESEVNFTFLTFGLIVSAFVVTLVVSNLCNCLIQMRIRRSKKNTQSQIDVTSREPENSREGLYEVIEVETEMSLKNITSASNIRTSLSTALNENMGLPTSSNINMSCLAETAQVISDTKDCSGSSHNSSISDASEKSNNYVSNETQYLNPYTVLRQNENTKREHAYNDIRSSVT